MGASKRLHLRSPSNRTVLRRATLRIDDLTRSAFLKP